MAEVHTLSPCVRAVGQLLKEAKANRIRSLVWLAEAPDGTRTWSLAGDPPLDLDGMLCSLARMQHVLLCQEEKLEAEAEAEINE